MFSHPRIFRLCALIFFIWIFITTYAMANSDDSRTKRFSLTRRRTEAKSTYPRADAGGNDDYAAPEESDNGEREMNPYVEREENVNEGRDKSEESDNDGGQEAPSDGRQESNDKGLAENYDEREESNNDGKPEESSNDGEEEINNDGQEDNNYDKPEKSGNDGGEESNNYGQEDNNYDKPEESNNGGGREENNNGMREESNNDGNREEGSNYGENYPIDVSHNGKPEESSRNEDGVSYSNAREERHTTRDGGNHKGAANQFNPPVDEIGKQILDTEINDFEEGLFCPCDKPFYNNLKNTRRKMMRLSEEGIFPISLDDILDDIDDIDTTNITSTTNIVNTANNVTILKEPFPLSNVIKTNCYAKLNKNVKSNTIIIQYISIPGRKPFKVRCQPHTRPECAYTVVMERKTKLDNFDMNWQKYREGFGDAETEGAFFVGLDNLYALTKTGKRALKFGTYFQGEQLKGEFYNNFVIGKKKSGYKIVNLDVLANNTMVRRLRLGSKFITKDSDHGSGLSICAQQLEMGWWFSSRCKYASQMSSIRAYVKSPFVMAIRPNRCSSGRLL